MSSTMYWILLAASVWISYSGYGAIALFLIGFALVGRLPHWIKTLRGR